MIILCMVLEIIRHDSQSYSSFWAILLPFDPPNIPKNETFEKWKKKQGDIIILHLCTTNDDHMYGSWDIKHDRDHFLSFFLNSINLFLRYISF